MALVVIAKYDGIGDEAHVQYHYTATDEHGSPISNAIVLVDILNASSSKLNRRVVETIVADAAAKGYAIDDQNVIFDPLDRG